MGISDLIKALELELLNPEVRRSKSRLDELIADNFFEIGVSGRQYKKQDVINQLSVEAELKFTIQNFNTNEISPDTILATYQAENEISGSNKKIISSRSSIWKKKDGSWQIIFHQGTKLNS